jgi:hypothetical protein
MKKIGIDDQKILKLVEESFGKEDNEVLAQSSN